MVLLDLGLPDLDGQEVISRVRGFADVPIIVAVNKMDLEAANPDRVMQQLSEHDLIPESWGGETMFNMVSAVTGDGVEELLESLERKEFVRTATDSTVAGEPEIAFRLYAEHGSHGARASGPVSTYPFG